jgi:hypothetical protein
VIEGLLGVRLIVGKLITNELDGHVQKVLNDDDRKTYVELTLAKNLFIGEVQVFAETVALQMEMVFERLGDEAGFPTLEACYQGFDRTENYAKVEVLYQECIKLKSRYDQFAKDFKKNYPQTGETERLVLALVATGVFIGCFVAIAVHLTPVGWVLSGPLMALCAAGGGFSGVVAACAFMSKNEVEVAQAFLNDISARLLTLRNQLSTVRANSTLLKSADRRACKPRVRQIVDECRKIVKVCQKT